MGSVFDWEEVEEKCKVASLFIKNGKVIIDGSSNFNYTIPIYYNDDYLGFFSVFTKQRIGGIRMSLLIDLEEYFMDDLLIRLSPKYQITN